MDYSLIKWIHIVSATILFGTGLGSAFYLFVANRCREINAISFTARWVVIADWIFTTPAFIVQILTGYLLIDIVGYDYDEPWLLAAYGLIALAGASWLPVLWVQVKMRDMAFQAKKNTDPLPGLYWKFERIWTFLGCIGFTAFMGVFFLMVVRPNFP